MKYFCTECNEFVKDENHRCEQWSNVIRIPDIAFQNQEVNFSGIVESDTTVNGAIDELVDYLIAQDSRCIILHPDTFDKIEHGLYMHKGKNYLGSVEVIADSFVMGDKAYLVDRSTVCL